MALESSQGWACQDCTFLLANGDTPEDWDEERTQAWLNEIARRSDGYSIVLGGEHDEDCPNLDSDGNWLGHEDCYCERIDFSMSPCEVCGSHLGGDRHAVTYFRQAVES